jgi:hypothetical protein
MAFRLVAFACCVLLATAAHADHGNQPEPLEPEPLKPQPGQPSVEQLQKRLLAMPEPNSVDSGANKLTVLSPLDHTAIEAYRLQKGFERGTVVLVFPQKGMVPIIGEQAEQWIVGGNPIAGFAYGGMPVSEFGSVAWARQNLKANRDHALKKAKGSELYKDALASVVKAQPSLAKAAKRFDVLDPALHQALVSYGTKNERFAAAHQVLQNELNAPVVAVVNGFGVPNAGDGQDHFHKGIRPKNRSFEPAPDVADEKVAKLIFERWKNFAKVAKLDEAVAKGGVGALIEAMRHPQTRMLFGTSLIGHCAGGSNASNTAMHLAKLVKDNAKEFPLGRYFLGTASVIGYGAAFNTPKGLLKSAFYIGKDDHFGRLNSQEKALIATTINVNANHMMNPDNFDALEQQPALRTRAVAEVLGHTTFADRPGPDATPAERLAHRLASLKKSAGSLVEQAEAQRTMGKQFDRSTAGRLKNWMLSTALTKVSLTTLDRVYTARAARVTGLTKVLEARQMMAQAESVEASTPKEARELRRKASELRKEGWREAKSAKRSENYAWSSAKSKGQWLDWTMNWHGQHAGWEYTAGVHGANNTEIEKGLLENLGKEGLVERKVEQVKVGQKLKWQLARTQLRATIAWHRVRWGMFDEVQKAEVVPMLRKMAKNVNTMRRNIGVITPDMMEAIRDPEAAQRRAQQAQRAQQQARGQARRIRPRALRRAGGGEAHRIPVRHARR